MRRSGDSTEITPSFEKCFPLFKARSSTCDPPFMSPLVKHLLKVRKKAVLPGADPILWKKRGTTSYKIMPLICGVFVEEFLRYCPVRVFWIWSSSGLLFSSLLFDPILFENNHQPSTCLLLAFNNQAKSQMTTNQKGGRESGTPPPEYSPVYTNEIPKQAFFCNRGLIIYYRRINCKQSNFRTTNKEWDQKNGGLPQTALHQETPECPGQCFYWSSWN